MWSKVYGQGYPSYTAWDLKQKFGRSNSTADASKKYNRNVCFKQLAIGIYGPAAPITVASWDTPCMKTALVRAYSDFVIRGLNLQDKTHYAEKQPSKTIVVTYMARRPSKEWPEKKYCDSENSFFLCHLWEKFGSRKLSRTIRNEKEFITGIKDLERMKFDNVDKVIVRDVDYNVLSFEEQIEIDLSTDIMIGPHGAGLMHNIFMRDRATLIELFIDGSSANRHFHNLAYWYGRSYNGVNIGNPIDVKHVQNILINTIKNTRVDQY